MVLATPQARVTFTGGEGISNLHVCAYYRTSHAAAAAVAFAVALSQTNPEREKGHDHRGQIFFFFH